MPPSVEVFRDWVANWEEETIQTTNWYDISEDYDLEIDNEGRRAVRAIGKLVLSSLRTPRETAYELVFICSRGLIRPGMEPRGIWKALCVAIEVFCCHKGSRLKLTGLLAEMAKYDLFSPTYAAVQPREGNSPGILPGWSSAFDEHFCSRLTSLPSHHVPVIASLTHTRDAAQGTRRLLYSAAAFQATRLRMTWNHGPNQELGSALDCAMTHTYWTLGTPINTASDLYLEETLPAALEWIRIAGTYLFKACAANIKGDEYPFREPYRFQPGMWDYWKSNLAYVQTRPGLDERLKEKAELALELMIKYVGKQKYSPNLRAWLRQ
ncbi:hypothetical protein PG993_004765 [Apiospora rasikravindrae]|uniref:Uncharacterized protein n=1 Tax=Apiospora rasikravindrae TaxID=990691 RepID=A0ABR1TDN7_9PEZI